MPPKKVKGMNYEATEWCNVFRSGLKLYYRSRESSFKLVSASTMEELKRQLTGMGIKLVKRQIVGRTPTASRAKASMARASTAGSNAKSKAKSNAKSKAKAKANAVKRRKRNRSGPFTQGKASDEAQMPKRRRVRGKQSKPQPQVLSRVFACPVLISAPPLPCQCPGGRLRKLEKAKRVRSRGLRPPSLRGPRWRPPWSPASLCKCPSPC